MPKVSIPHFILILQYLLFLGLIGPPDPPIIVHFLLSALSGLLGLFIVPAGSPGLHRIQDNQVSGILSPGPAPAPVCLAEPECLEIGPPEVSISHVVPKSILDHTHIVAGLHHHLGIQVIQQQVMAHKLAEGAEYQLAALAADLVPVGEGGRVLQGVVGQVRALEGRGCAQEELGSGLAVGEH